MTTLPTHFKFKINGNNTTVLSFLYVLLSVGDHVLIRSPGEKDPPYVGFVKRIMGGSDPKVTVTWFYRPQETKFYKDISIGEKELFYSSVEETHSAETIMCKCTVHTFHSYTKLENITTLDFYCRYKYDHIKEVLTAGDKTTVAV